jgi:hypothetical protein
VVGIIKTGLLNFFTYDANTMRFQFNPEFKNQDNDRYAVFMNSVKSQPFGYVVLQEHLETSITNPYYYNTFVLNNMSLIRGDKSYGRGACIGCGACDQDSIKKQTSDVNVRR